MTGTSFACGDGASAVVLDARRDGLDVALAGVLRVAPDRVDRDAVVRLVAEGDVRPPLFRASAGLRGGNCLVSVRVGGY
jgi:hypothetical protein